MYSSLRAWIDLTRFHFAWAWPLLFCSGLALAYREYGGFAWTTTVTVALIGLFGFEGGMVLNDIVDRERDTRDIDPSMTRYWRLFGTRPLPLGLITPGRAAALVLGFLFVTTALIFTLPPPHSQLVFVIMVFAYCAEIFYQLKKRQQAWPIAQLVGRTDFALFPVAGYLAAGQPDTTALLYFLFFYPFAEAHLAVNDLADIANDRAREMASVTVLHGEHGTAVWILLATIIHAGFALLFAARLGWIARGGFLLGLLLLTMANVRIFQVESPKTALAQLPYFHVAMAVYAVSIIADTVL
ncbi:MAG: prenyltransferase [Methanoculleus sp. SDB]|nr:MAG: prenyltransferase [Methanoculleus sp. SDB]